MSAPSLIDHFSLLEDPRKAWRGSKTGYSWIRVDVARSGDGTLTFQVRCEMDRCVGAAARLPESDRKDLAIQAVARSETVSDLAAPHGVSRKFVYQQTHKAVAALDDAFSPATPDDEVLFDLAVTKAWLRQVIVGLTLICRSSYRGVVEFLRDLLGVPVAWFKKCHFHVTPGIDRALMVKGLLVLGVTLI